VNANTCPVCGYWMEVPPADYNICSSCGTEFTPFVGDFKALREAWVETGTPWWSQYNAKPEDWNPWLQMHRLSLNATTLQGLDFSAPIRREDLNIPATNTKAHKHKARRRHRPVDGTLSPYDMPLRSASGG
jgi:hypothetical protein